MSQALQANGHDEGAAAAMAAGEGAVDQQELEARARVSGWRPREEYRGPPGQFVDAAEYLRRAETDMPLMRQRMRSMQNHIEKLTRENGTAVTLLEDMGERVRRTEEVAYKRARSDLEREREEAVQSGDVQRFREVDRELREVESNAPKPPPAKPAVQTAPGAAPEVVDWAARNPWFNQDQTLASAAREISRQLQIANPDMPIEENLERVTSAVKSMFPAKFRREQQADGDEEGDGGAARAPANTRRQAAAAVAGAGPAAPARGGGPRRDFASMPQEVKDQFHRYQKMIGSKPGNKPLTEAEWSDSYWSQFD